MKILLTLDQHEMGYEEPDDQEISWTRHAARAVLTNDKGQYALMHFTVTGSYKLPGGGIDEGEEIIDALRREVREEAGYEIDNIAELGIIEENRYFARGMHQTSYCFSARVTKFVGTDLTEKEAAQGMELVWCDTIDEAIRRIKSADTLDEDGSEAGLAMMIAREVAILEAARI